MTPDSLIVIRAGATDYEQQGRIRGAVDIPLCAAGIAEAEHAAALLTGQPVVALYTAKEGCAVETGRIIGQALGLKPRGVADLQNLHQGLWQGMLVEEIRRKQPRLYRQWQDNPWAVAPPEGELLEEACERVEAAIERLFRRHGEGRVALVVPEPIDRIVRWLVAGESMGDLWARDPHGEPLAEIPVATQWAGKRPSGRRQPTPI
ncbi:MAG: histidine phosphatase family protein [Planctomycetia bacterium]